MQYEGTVTREELLAKPELDWELMGRCFCTAESPDYKIATQESADYLAKVRELAKKWDADLRAVGLMFDDVSGETMYSDQWGYITTTIRRIKRAE